MRKHAIYMDAAIRDFADEFDAKLASISRTIDGEAEKKYRTSKDRADAAKEIHTSQDLRRQLSAAASDYKQMQEGLAKLEQILLITDDMKLELNAVKLD